MHKEKTMSRKNGKVTPHEFVKAWQTSTSVIEVAKKTNMKLGNVRSRASVYRKKGFPLRSMRRGRQAVDWNGLADYARKLEVKK